jgi:peptidoglycan/xylan/chitin deacetylase (PgdA/CDA1 family)
MNLKRSAKTLALNTISSSPGLAGPLLKRLHMGYGPVSGARPAVACISVDFDVTVPSRFEDNRRGTLALSELAGRYGIPLTWAVCGKSAEEDLTSYSAIADSFHDNEIGVHTYSHLDATASTAAEFRSDIERCIESLGLRSPRTFVFPWNREGHFGVLRKLGFSVYRGKSRAMGDPVQKEGLWNVRPVYYVDQRSRGAADLMKKYVDMSINFSVPFHLWTHPWALAIGGDTEPMIRTLESLFSYLGEKRDQKVLTTSTLGGIAASLDSGAAKVEGEPISNPVRI